MTAACCGTYAVGAAVEIAVEIAVDFAAEIVVEIAMASATGLHGLELLATAFRGSPWKPVEGPRPVECPRLSVERRGHSRGIPWRSVDTAAVFRQKDK